MADEEEIFKEANSKLFGNVFERIAKERAEAVKLLKGARPPHKPQGNKPFFRTNHLSHPQMEGSYQSFQVGKTISSLSLDKDEKTSKRPNPSKDTTVNAGY